jgi:hypothetical protein
MLGPVHSVDPPTTSPPGGASQTSLVDPRPQGLPRPEGDGTVGWRIAVVAVLAGLMLIVGFLLLRGQATGPSERDWDAPLSEQSVGPEAPTAPNVDVAPSQPAEPPPEAPAEPDSNVAPQSLAEMVPTTVVGYALTGTKEDTNAAYSEIEAVYAYYQGPNDEALVHRLALFPSVTEAFAEAKMFYDGLVAGGATINYEEGDAETYVAFLTAADGLEWVVWHNGNMAATIVGPPAAAANFYNALPY